MQPSSSSPLRPARAIAAAALLALQLSGAAASSRRVITYERKGVATWIVGVVSAGFLVLGLLMGYILMMWWQRRQERRDVYLNTPVSGPKSAAALAAAAPETPAAAQGASPAPA